MDAISSFVSLKILMIILLVFLSPRIVFLIFSKLFFTNRLFRIRSFFETLESLLSDHIEEQGTIKLI